MIDVHSHLMLKEFDPAEVPELIARAKEAGVDLMLNVGCGIESSRQSVEMSAQYPELYATVGLHPYDAADLSEELMEEWEALIHKNKRIVAVGEIGLDYFKVQTGYDVQREAFRRQLELAREVDLPVIVHNRNADEDTLSILGDFSEVRAVFHCYASDLAFARKVWNAGHMTSFTGIVTYPKNDELREVCKEVPMNMFLVETDCPYLAPQKYRGQRNEPSYVTEVAALIAEMKGLGVAEVAEASHVNTLEMFERINA